MTGRGVRVINYKLIYDRLISRAKIRGTPSCYCEVHHIVPRCMGGCDAPENLVSLTAREHYIAHLLLYKIHSDEPGLIYSAYRMSAKNNRHYAILREKFIQNQRKRKTQTLEYRGKYYYGFDDLKDKTGVTNYLYHKYYAKGQDPEPYINNNTHGMIANIKLMGGPKHAIGAKWYNNGHEEKYSSQVIEGWSIGRLSKVRDNATGRWVKIYN